MSPITLRQVLECASPLALSGLGKESGRGLPHSRTLARGVVATAVLFAVCHLAASGAELAVKIVPRFNGTPLMFDSLTNTTGAVQTISVTRLDFLLSNFALRSANGAWVENTNSFAFVSGREGRTAFELPAPAGHFDRIRFNVGLAPRINHYDPAAFPANHPLNPE